MFCLYVHQGVTVWFLTTATQPSAGMLSLTADRWLKKLLARFCSLKFWISWMCSESGFIRSWSSIWERRKESGRGGCRRQGRDADKGGRLETGRVSPTNIMLHLNQIINKPDGKRSTGILLLPLLNKQYPDVWDTLHRLPRSQLHATSNS